MRPSRPTFDPRRNDPVYIDKFPIPGRNIEKAKALLKDASVQLPIKIDLMVPNGPDTRQVAEVIQAMVARGRNVKCSDGL